MTIAYLIVAHHQPKHLFQLVKALEDRGTYFFIHIDRKADITPFQRLLVGMDNIVWIEDREAVYWGGFSQVKASLKLLMRARHYGPSFRYYCLLSGSDFPIRHKHIIQQNMRYPIQYLRVDRPLDQPPMNVGFEEHLSKYHFLDQFPLLCPKYQINSFTQRIARRSLSKLVNIVNGCLPSRRYPFGLVPYHGSAWWCLTDDCVRYILRFVASNPEYVRFFYYVKSADEIFYHSIVKESPFAADIRHNFERGTAVGDEHGSHYIAWRLEDDPNSPKVLTEVDYSSLVLSNALFARKFDETKSRAIVEMLERDFVKQNKPVLTTGVKRYRDRNGRRHSS